MWLVCVFPASVAVVLLVHQIIIKVVEGDIAFEACCSFWHKCAVHDWRVRVSPMT